MSFPRTSTLALWLVPILLVTALATDADAQRRRRRRKKPPTPPPAAEPAEPAAEEGGDGDDEAPEGEPAAAGEDASEEGASGDEGTPAATTAAEAATDLFESPDLGPLKAQLTEVMDDLIKARSRIAVLGRQLFKTRVRIAIDNDAGRDQVLSGLSVMLDGAPVYRGDADAFAGDDPRQVFDGFAAPGPHTVTIEAEQRSRENDAYRYTVKNTYRFEVLKGKLTEIKVVLDDDSDIAEDFPDDEEGEYDVRMRVRVATRALE